MLVEIESGSITIFKQAVAPVGWIKLTDINDCTLRVTNNTYQSQGSGSIPVSTFFTTPQTITAPINVGGYVNPAKAELPIHKHVYGKILSGDMGWYQAYLPSPSPQNSNPFQFLTMDDTSVYVKGITEQSGGIGSLTEVIGPSVNYMGRWYPPGDCKPHTHPLSGTMSMPVTINNTMNIKYVDVIRAKRK